MNDLNLGKIITTSQQRDAVHIAVAPVVAHHDLAPGQPIGFVKEGNTELVGVCKVPIGVADPFLKGVVLKGQRFWMFLNPNTITALRHDWTHPAFVEKASKLDESESRLWIEAFAVELHQTYADLMDAAAIWVKRGEYTYDNSEAYKNVDYDKWPIFWKHYENVTGKKVANHEDTFFTCSC